jgi:hypothetical protein
LDESEKSKSSTVTVIHQEEEIICLNDATISAVVSEPFGDNLQVLPLLLFSTLTNRYNLIDCLESLKPRYLILYHSDIACTRVIEVSYLVLFDGFNFYIFSVSRLTTI